jgi:HD-like signal output (HDOD) protein
METAPVTIRRIGELLVRDGIISEEQLQEALRKQVSEGGKIVENLMALGYLDTHTFVRFLSKQPGTASIDLLNYTIPAEVIALVDREFAIKHQLVPIDKMGRDLTVGMACPMDAATVKELEQKTGMKVRPLLVSMSDVRTALKNYYRDATAPQDSYFLDSSENLSLSARVVAPGTASISLVQSGLKFEKVVHLIRKLSALPALPETVHQVRRAMDNPDTSTDDVARIVGRDPSLAAKVVSLANSSAYAFMHRVDTIERATALLGLREVYGVVIGSAVIDYFKEGNHFNHKAFWRRSLACATACKLIAKVKRPEGTGSLFAAGLMYDIGRAVFAEIAPKPYAEVDQRLPEERLIEVENELFGLAHPEVGFLLADGWGLPAEISEPIRFHHDYQQAHAAPVLVAIVALGATIASALDETEVPDIAALAEANAGLLQFLGLSAHHYVRFFEETKEAMERQAEGQ